MTETTIHPMLYVPVISSDEYQIMLLLNKLTRFLICLFFFFCLFVFRFWGNETVMFGFRDKLFT